METPHFKPETTTETQEREPRILQGIVFAAREAGGAMQYQSSARDRKMIKLSADSPKPVPGLPYRVRVIKDTKPENPMEGMFLVEVLVGPEEEKQQRLALARGAEEALAKNDLKGVFEKLKALQRAIGAPEGGVESPEQRERLSKLEIEFARQTQVLLNKHISRFVNMTEEAFYVQVFAPLKIKLGELAKREFPEGHIPFIIVPSDKLLSIRQKASLAFLNGQQFDTTFMGSDHNTLQGLVIPDSLAYLIVDVEDGWSTLGQDAEQATNNLRRGGREPLTADEGLALMIQHPEILKNHSIKLPGTYEGGGDQVSSLWLDGNIPRLSLVGIRSTEIDVGTASCGGRIGPPSSP